MAESSHNLILEGCINKNRMAKKKRRKVRKAAREAILSAIRSHSIGAVDDDGNFIYKGFGGFQWADE